MDHSSNPSSSENTSTENTSTSSWSSNSFSSISYLTDSARLAQRDPLGDLKILFDCLFRNSKNVPGPKLLRIKQEFNLCNGEGGEGTIYGASIDFARNLEAVSAKVRSSDEAKVGLSARAWRSCVVKQLRSDGDRHLAFQTNSAKTEINILAKEVFRQHPHIVSLQGWALCLDSLEAPTSSIPRLPLLILEKASFDLKFFLSSKHYSSTSHEELCAICLGVGRGLEALHGERMAHGDIKPANILLFDAYATARVPQSIPCPWIPKLCDFGLATSFRDTPGHASKMQNYKGTAGWKPPETSTVLPPKSFPLCDIFAYGLVVWAIFLGISSSPIAVKDRPGEDPSTEAPSNSQQKFFVNASRSLRVAYDLTQTDIFSIHPIHWTERFYDNRPDSKIGRFINWINLYTYQISDGIGDYLAPTDREKPTLAALAGSSFNIASKPNDDRRPLQSSRKVFMRLPHEIRETQMNRVLLVLRQSLNDIPSFRSENPWKYMDPSLYENVGPVEDLPGYYLATPRERESRDLGDLLRPHRETILQIIDWVEELPGRANQVYLRTIKRSFLLLRVYFYRWLPSLLPQNPLQQVYGRLMNRVYSMLPQNTLGAFGSGPLAKLDHGDDVSCPDLRPMLEVFSSAFFGRKGPLGLERWRECDELYAFAIFRSRIKMCCWRQYWQHIADEKEVSNEKSPEEVALEEDKTRLAAFMRSIKGTRDVATLAWLCRGEVGLATLFKLQEDAELLWSWMAEENADMTASTYIMVLLLERFCAVGHETKIDGTRITPFRYYLEVLTPKLNSESAINVCHHFRRIEASENASDAARYYLAGQSPDVRDDHNVNESDFVTTALHDAVSASNYDVVEYLVRTDFIIDVLDNSGKTALGTAKSLPKTTELSKASNIANNQIIALLSQGKRERKSRLTLPVGWDEVKLPGRSFFYRETSIDSDVDPLTFIKPRAGLLEERRLALGQRKIKGSGGQTYYLDPLRFMHTKSKVAAAQTDLNATEPAFGDDWYIKNLEELASPPKDPFTDGRRWYRILLRTVLTLKAALEWLFSFALSTYGIAILVLLALLMHDAWTAVSSRFMAGGSSSEYGLRENFGGTDNVSGRIETCAVPQPVQFPMSPAGLSLLQYG